MTLKFRDPPTQLHPNILLYGGPKTGKTLGACSAPGPVALINADLPNATWHVHRRYGEKIMEVEVEGLQSLIDVILNLRQQVADGLPIVSTVVLDPVADLHRVLLEEESNRAIRPSRDAYGNVAVHVERFCRELCRLPIATVIVCHEIVQRDEESGAFERLPFTGTSTPTLGAKLMAMVDIIGYTGVIETEDSGRVYAAQLTAGGGRRGGSRYDVLGDWQPLDISGWLEQITTNIEETENVQPVR